MDIAWLASYSGISPSSEPPGREPGSRTPGGEEQKGDATMTPKEKFELLTEGQKAEVIQQIETLLAAQNSR